MCKQMAVLGSSSRHPGKGHNETDEHNRRVQVGRKEVAPRVCSQVIENAALLLRGVQMSTAQMSTHKSELVQSLGQQVILLLR